MMMKKGKVPDEMEKLHFLHGLRVDPWDNVWVTDVGRHLVMRFDPEGKLTLTLGIDGEPGCDDEHFNQPTHACVAPSGEIFVTDGYGNSRVVKFTPEGKFIKDWGQRGTEPGQFHTPHVIVLGRDGYLYVSDRENDRIQIFDQDGALVAIWSGLYSVDCLCQAPDGKMYGSVGMTNSIIEFDAGGGARQVWVRPDLMDYPHGLWVDGEGSVYVSETGEGPKGDRLVKFRRTPK
jgi:DNA-binding beta-propeller fold protein YncE